VDSVRALCNFSHSRFQPQGGNVQYIEGCADFDRFSGMHKLSASMCTGASRLKIALILTILVILLHYYAVRI
jgi:hypothetical protein